MSDSETYLPRPYCTQPRKIGETCWGCSLVNYQRDCMNNPVAPPPDEEEDDTSPDNPMSASGLARLAAVGLAQDTMSKLLREMDFHDCNGQWRKPIRYQEGIPLADWEHDLNRYGGRYWGQVTPRETRGLLTQTLEQAEFMQEEKPEAWRDEWITRARQVLGRPATAT